MLLISAHIAEGNLSEASRQFEIYRHLLWHNLQLQPSHRIASLVAGALSA